MPDLLEKQKKDFDRLVEFEKKGTLSAQVIKSSNLAIKAKTLEGVITSWNSGAEVIYGYTSEEMIGKNVSVLFPPGHPDEFKSLIKKIRQGRVIRNFETKRAKKDGTIIDILLYLSPIKNDAGEIIGVASLDRDISDVILAGKEFAFQNEEKAKRAGELAIANKELVFQNTEKEKRAAELIIANKELLFQQTEKGKRAAELVIADKELLFQNKEKVKQDKANKQLKTDSSTSHLASLYTRSIIEAGLDPLFVISPEGRIIDVNKATLMATEKKRTVIKDSYFDSYFTEPKNASSALREIFKNTFIADCPLTLKDGKTMPVLCNGSIYKDEMGKVLGAVIVARDVTDQTRIATELFEAKIFAEVATAIAEEAKNKAEKATRIAEEAVRAKQQFLSNMSHEIRTPMNAIIGFTKVILKTELNAKQREYLTAIKLSGDALIVLINDILDLAKVDAGKMTFEQIPFKMNLSISAMLHLFEAKIQEKNLELITNYDSRIPKVLLGDPVRLHQIILNLLSNAVKFTSSGKIIVDVKLLHEDEKNTSVKFTVTDTGIGIAENKIDRIFENFQQASSGTSRLYGGTGLGLAIVKQLVERQGGVVKVNSRVGEGSSFSFTLNFPKTTIDAEADTVSEITDKENLNIKVLVVEDIALNQLLMKTLLDDMGFQREIASNGKIAIEKLASTNFDIILMDLQMPEMNGFEATEYIRKTLKSRIPIIALTADVTTADLTKCKAVGMNDYISKPVDEKLLYNKILGLVKRSDQQPETDPAGARNVAKIKCIDLDYLIKCTKADPKLMMEMISLFLEQTTTLVSEMKQSFHCKDWELLQSTVHKMIPSFTIMGISADYEDMAKKIQEFAKTQLLSEGISEMIIQLENICAQACIELEEEFNTIKNKLA